MRSGILLLAAAGRLLGCDPGPPDGMRKVLFFEREQSFAAVGTTQRIVVPRHRTIGGHLEGKGVPYRTKRFDYDFHGTRIDVSVPAGSTLVSADLAEEGYAIVVRCDAPLRGILGVQIRKGAEARYADETYLECR